MNNVVPFKRELPYQEISDIMESVVKALKEHKESSLTEVTIPIDKD